MDNIKPGGEYIVRVCDDWECITERALTRCRDCRYWNKYDRTPQDVDGNEWHTCDLLSRYMPMQEAAERYSEDYCAYAVREKR